MVINVVKNASRPRSAAHLLTLNGKRFSFRGGWIVTLRERSCKCFLSRWELRICGAINKALLTLRNEKNSGDRELLSVYLDRGVIQYSDSSGMQVHKPSKDLSGYQNVYVGDFVLNNQQAWRGSVGVSRYDGIISPAYFVYKISSRGDFSYMNYLLRDMSMYQQYETASRGVGTIQRNIFAPWLLNCAVILPPVDEQCRIAAFLDAKCSEIDALSADIQSQIDVLEQYKRSVITETVTKGVNPDVEMKDSGIEYVGNIPIHWNMHPLYCYFSERKNKKDKSIFIKNIYYMLSYAFRILNQSNYEDIATEEFDKCSHVGLESRVFSNRRANECDCGGTL